MFIFALEPDEFAIPFKGPCFLTLFPREEVVFIVATTRGGILTSSGTKSLAEKIGYVAECDGYSHRL